MKRLKQFRANAEQLGNTPQFCRVDQILSRASKNLGNLNNDRFDSCSWYACLFVNSSTFSDQLARGTRRWPNGMLKKHHMMTLTNVNARELESLMLQPPMLVSMFSL
jgi:hypothetical protein